MNSAIRKVLVLACGVAAAIALGAPASAHAATAAATTPDLHASNCATGPSPQDFELENWATFDRDEIDPSTQDLYIGGGASSPLCQALVSTGIVQIFTTSTDYCLAYSQAANDAYQHVPTGCTLASPPNYMQWKFIFQFNGGPDGKVYELQTQFPDPQNGEKKCLAEIANTRKVEFDTCDGRNSELFYTLAV